MTAVTVREDGPRVAIEDQRGASITALLHLAVEKGTPVAELSKLVDLHERMEARQAVNDFADAMARFQAECPSIKKSSTASVATKGGAKYTYTYAELDEIARTVNPILARHGLSYTWDTTADEKMLTVVCTVRHAHGHAITSSFVLPVQSDAGMSPQQKYAAAATFAQRKSLSAALGLTTTDEDPDAALANPERITEDQATHLSDLLKETGTSAARFCVWLDSATVADIRAVDYPRALATLERKREGGR